MNTLSNPISEFKNERSEARNWFETLRDKICASFETFAFTTGMTSLMVLPAT